jgi:SAM-dependent methyltransferase
MTPSDPNKAAPLAMRPQGMAGKAFGVLMEAINTPAYGFALDLLALDPTSDVLEIGFGAGRMIEKLLEATQGRVVGVDPTPTMLEVALAKPGVRRAGARVTLRLGGDADLDWIDGPLDRVVANHSFQFWPDPEATVARLFALLKPGGRAVLMLRDHARQTSDWLPNPLSRAPDEADAAVRLFERCGFAAHLERRDRMTGLVADKPA